jgi:hypothetical protein
MLVRSCIQKLWIKLEGGPGPKTCEKICAERRRWSKWHKRPKQARIKLRAEEEEGEEGPVVQRDGQEGASVSSA